MRKTPFVFILILLLMSACFIQAQTPFSKAPEWTKSVIWYQIFVERFNNGDKTNDPKPQNTTVGNMNIVPPAGWKITSWTGDWFAKDDWMKGDDKNFGNWLQYRRYGGDLQGVRDKLDYMQELGITAVYINPINDAPSLHKYDARNYHHVDVNFGPDPEGDMKLMATENPADPTTWKWTSADKLFLKLVSELHKRNIRIIMDYSWNHTGTLFWAWQDILKNQAASPYKDWYNISSFDNPATPENEFSYSGWYGNAYMPEFTKTDIQGERVNGRPYEGNMNEGVKQHIFDVSKRWLAPDGILANGVDGYRLDVADQIGLGFWRDYRTFIRSVKSDAYLIGEIWWEKWPDKLMDPLPYMKGDMFDAVMFYQIYRPARYFFAKTDFSINAAQLKDSLTYHWNRLDEDKRYAMMNTSATHDTPRMLTDFFNPNKYKTGVSPQDNSTYKTGKPDAETYQRLKLYLVFAFTSVGAPQVWNGDEMGMWGADDPYGRKPLWWKEMKFSPENRNNFQPVKKTEYDKVGFNSGMFEYYKKLIALRKAHPVLSSGKFDFTEAQGNRLVYRRYGSEGDIYVIFNMGQKSEKFTLPQSNYVDLLSGKKHTNQIQLPKMTSVILKSLK